MIGSDFNLPGWNWVSDSIGPDCLHKRYHTDFRDVLNDHRLTQVVHSPRTRNKNTLELIITNHSSLVQRVDVLSGFADHDIVYLEMVADAKRLRKLRRKIYLNHRLETIG